MEPTKEEIGFAAGILHTVDIDPKARRVLDKVVSWLLAHKQPLVFHVNEQVVFNPPNEAFYNSSGFHRIMGRKTYTVVKVKNATTQDPPHPQEILIGDDDYQWWSGIWFKKA